MSTKAPVVPSRAVARPGLGHSQTVTLVVTPGDPTASEHGTEASEEPESPALDSPRWPAGPPPGHLDEAL